jgi:hypothetical protein
MQVIFTKAMKLGGRVFAKGKQEAPDHLFYNVAFKKLVQSGAVQVVPRDAASQKIQTSKDMKVLQKAKVARKAALAKKANKALQSVQGASSANPTTSSVSGSDQALPTPATPISAGAAAQASVPAAPVTAQVEKE